jgi:hypothetical protein
MLCNTHQFPEKRFAIILELEVAVIIIDFGRLGRAKLHRPTWLELLALVVLLAFVAMVVFRP